MHFLALCMLILLLPRRWPLGCTLARKNLSGTGIGSAELLCWPALWPKLWYLGPRPGPNVFPSLIFAWESLTAIRFAWLYKNIFENFQRNFSQLVGDLAPGPSGVHSSRVLAPRARHRGSWARCSLSLLLQQKLFFFSIWVSQQKSSC